MHRPEQLLALCIEREQVLDRTQRVELEVWEQVGQRALGLGLAQQGFSAVPHGRNRRGCGLGDGQDGLQGSGATGTGVWWRTVSALSPAQFHVLQRQQVRARRKAGTKKSRLVPALAGLAALVGPPIGGAQPRGASATSGWCSAGATCCDAGCGLQRLIDITTATRARAKTAGSVSKRLGRT